MIRNGGRYASLLLGAGALLWLAEHGIVPIKLREVNEHLGQQDEYLIEDRLLDRSKWQELLRRKDVVFCLVWFFVTAGPNVALPADFNIASNQINVIGNGAGGGGGQAGAAGSQCLPSCGGGGC